MYNGCSPSSYKEKVTTYFADRFKCGMLFSFHLYKPVKDVCLFHQLYCDIFCVYRHVAIMGGSLTVPLEGPELALNLPQPNKYFVYLVLERI